MQIPTKSKIRIPVIAGNWKMNKTVEETLNLTKALHRELQPYREIKKSEILIEIIIAPPFTAINAAREVIRGPHIGISAQNLFWEESGAFTGEISAPMLKDAGVDYAIVGHSERRQLFHETDTTVNKKIHEALQHEIKPLFCIGETLEEREAGRLEEVIATQIFGGLEGITQKDITKIIIAYEPVWAIGTGKTATPAEAEEAHLMIRKLLADKFGQRHADAIRILYGGSVKPSNAEEILSKPNIDGALVGGASLKAEDFTGIVKALM